MLLVMIDIACAFAFAAAGLAAGLWLARHSLRAARHAQDDTAQAQAVLADIRVVVARAAGDIGAHSEQVRDINDELTADQAAGSEAIVSTVARLVAANQELRQRLAEADTRLQEQSQQLDAHLAEAKTDILTRLPNRRAFDTEALRRYAEYQRNGTPFSLVVLDLDQFQQINERVGTQAGDQLLQSVAAALLDATRVVDLPARFGGNRFAVLLQGTTIDEACEVAKRHQKAIAKVSYVYQDRRLSVTASAGAAQIMPGELVEVMIRRAERALYLAKKAGCGVSLWHDGRAIRSNVGLADQGGSPAAGEKKPKPAENPPSRATPPETPPKAGETGPTIVAPAAPQPQADEGPPAKTPAPAEKPAVQPHGPQGKPLTNECDRTVFVWQVRQSIAQGNRDGASFSVMLVQVDEYDRLKKLHGEAVADVALRAMRLLLGAAVREMDIVGHYAPSCFSVLLPRTPLRDALRVAERLQDGATQCLIPTEAGSLEVTMSISLAEFSEGDDVLRLLRRAETALSAAGKNRTCYHNGRSLETVEPGTKPQPSASAADCCVATTTETQIPCSPTTG